VSRNQEPIPADAEGQAEYWRRNYNPGADDGMVSNWLKTANTLLVGEAFAAVDAGGTGMVTDVAGNAFPAQFTATLPSTQLSVQRRTQYFLRKQSDIAPGSSTVHEYKEVMAFDQ
jgi:hypothetical protein